MNSITRYFPDLSPAQVSQFERMEALYAAWNNRINVISRKDIEHLAVHHILHSLAIARAIRFRPGTEVMDAGSGGGFPGIPLAVIFPEVNFTLVDSIGKKTRVISEVASSLELKNIRVLNQRFEEVKGSFDFVTGRAVSRLSLFWRMVSGAIRQKGCNDLANGVLYLTGGEVEDDLFKTGAIPTTWNISSWFPEPWFETKKLIHLRKPN